MPSGKWRFFFIFSIFFSSISILLFHMNKKSLICGIYSYQFRPSFLAGGLPDANRVYLFPAKDGLVVLFDIFLGSSTKQNDSLKSYYRQFRNKIIVERVFRANFRKWQNNFLISISTQLSTQKLSWKSISIQFLTKKFTWNNFSS